MGSVEIDRRIYEFRTEEGKLAYKFLLDEYLGMDKIGHMSINLVENIISNLTEVSYRKTAENIELMCLFGMSCRSLELELKIVKKERLIYIRPANYSQVKKQKIFFIKNCIANKSFENPND